MSVKRKPIKTKSRKPILTLDVSPDGQQFVLGQERLFVGSVKDARVESDVAGEKNEKIIMARYSPSGGAVAYIDTGDGLHLYDVESGEVSKPKLKNKNLTWIDYAARADRLAVTGAHTQVLDGGSMEVVWTLPGKPRKADGTLALAALSADGKRVAVAGAEAGKVLIFEVESGELVGTLEDAPDGARRLSFDPRGRFLAAVESNSHGLFFWNVRSGKRHLPETYGAENQGSWSMCFHPKGAYAAVGRVVGFLSLEDLKSGAPLWLEKHKRGYIWDMAFTPDGKQLLTGGNGGEGYVWEVKTGE
jgi:WD40 repeat protein